MQAAPSLRAWTLIILLGGVWGASFFLVEVALAEVPPLTVVAHRVVWAAIALWLFLWARGNLKNFPLRLWPRWAVMGLLNNAIPFTLIVWGQTQIESGLASIFNAMTAVFGVLAAALFISAERLTLNKVIGAILGVAGVAIIVGAEALAGLDPRSLGQLAILGAALSYALASVWGRLQLKDAPPEINALGMLTASAVLMTPI